MTLTTQEKVEYILIGIGIAVITIGIFVLKWMEEMLLNY